jgi:hypothetical protein
VIPEMIEARSIRGFRHIDLMRRDLGRRDRVRDHHVVRQPRMRSRPLSAEDAEVSHVPPAARAVLSRFDERAAHYDVLDRRPQSGA